MSLGGVPLQVLVGSIFNTAVNATTNFFAAPGLAPNRTPCTFRIYVALSTSGVLSVQRTSAASVTVSESLNNSVALVAGTAYIFDVQVDFGETINLQTSVTATILKCLVTEIDTA